MFARILLFYGPFLVKSAQSKKYGKQYHLEIRGNLIFWNVFVYHVILCGEKEKGK